MAPDKLTPDDSRVEHKFFTVSGRTYHYLLGTPSSTPAATILLVHGFPDLSFGWRYQVPLLLSLNLRVIVPDTLGYGRTDAPQPLEHYSMKSMSADLAALASHVVPGQRIILGGHDWGGALVWRMALWHPNLVAAVFSVCTPYGAPRAEWIPPDVFFSFLPNFRYQLQLAGPDVEGTIVGEERLRQFLDGMYGGIGTREAGPGEAKAKERAVLFSTEKGVHFENLDKVGPSPLLSREEIEFYVKEYARHGMRGPLNWYRTRKINYEEELELVKADRTRIPMPAMMVVATKDAALPPAMAESMDRHFDSLVKRTVDAGHWALWQAAEQTNAHIKEFITGLLRNTRFIKSSI